MRSNGTRTLLAALTALAALGCADDKARKLTSQAPDDQPTDPGDVYVTPPSARLPTLGSQSFVATPPAVRWSVREGPPGGSISASGLYLAPETTGSYLVYAFEPISATTVEVPITVFAAPPGTYLGMEIPPTHPRIGFDPALLATARARYAAAPFQVVLDADGGYMDLALRGLLTSSATDCRTALNLAITRNNTLATMGGSSLQADDSRWWGELIIAIYDWCYPYLTPAERTTFISNTNTWIEQRRTGGLGGFFDGQWKYQGNYYWGNLRNQVLWGLASYEDNVTAAERFLSDAITARYRGTGGFVAHDTGWNVGGVAHEGSEYGPMVTDFANLAFVTAKLMGVDLFAEANYWPATVYAAIYSTAPGPDAAGEYHYYPHSDVANGAMNGTRVNLDPTQFNLYGNFMSTAARMWATSSVGQHAKAWMNKVQARRTAYAAMTDPMTTTPRDLAALPLDYYASGLEYLYARSGAGTDASGLFLQLGGRDAKGSDGHYHTDWGGVGAWWRKGRWVLRETTGYGSAHSLVSYGGSGTEASHYGIAHNILYVEGAPIAPSPHVINYGLPPLANQATVTRLDTQPGYAYAAVDELPTKPNGSRPDNTGNPHFVSWVREFVFFRGLEALVVLDRIQSDHAADAKTAISHCETNPTIAAATATCVVGTQALDQWTLLPATGVTNRVITEGSAVGQYRIETVTAPGAAQSYILTVMKARDSTAGTISPAVVDNGTSYTVTLDGSNAVTFEKGMASAGGTITVAGAAPVALRTTVRRMDVGPGGPVWAP